MTRDPKFRLGSDEWIAGLRRCLSEVTSHYHEAANAFRFRIVETVTDVPADLATEVPAGGSLSWHIVIEGQRSYAGRGRLEAPDIDLSYDYQAFLQLSRWIYDETDEPAVAKFRAKLLREGRLHVAGSSTAVPVLLAALLRDLHNRIAMITA